MRADSPVMGQRSLTRSTAIRLTVGDFTALKKLVVLKQGSSGRPKASDAVRAPALSFMSGRSSSDMVVQASSESVVIRITQRPSLRLIRRSSFR